MDALLAQLMMTFAEELEERTADLDRDLLALEKEADHGERDRILESLLRTAHSLKGAAGSVNIDIIGLLCHGLEDILEPARNRHAEITPDQWKLCFATADALRSAGRQIALGQEPDEGELGSIVARMADLSREDGPAPELQPEPLPEPSPQAVSRFTPSPGPPSEPLVMDPARAPAAVRIPAEKLDTLLTQSGELLLARRRADSRREDVGQLRYFIKDWRSDWKGQAGGKFGRGDLDRFDWIERELLRLDGALASDQHLIEAAARPLHAEVTRLRMLPFSAACEGLARTARDLALANGKEVELTVEGGAVEIDRSVLDGLRAPLLHLVRNAVDHGIGTPDRRRVRGKPTQGRITVSAALRADKLEVVVADDGAGLRLDDIRAQMRRRNLPEVAEADLAEAIFMPGFSTSAELTSVSGRGIGLDAVKSAVEAMRGTVAVTSAPWAGTQFTLSLPLTLTTIRAVLAEACGQVFALDGASVRKAMTVSPEELRWAEGVPLVKSDDALVPVIDLAEALGETRGVTWHADDKFHLILLTAEGQVRAFVVDALLSEQEVVVRSLGPRLAGLRNIAGATILPTGRIALILNTVDLMRAALRGSAALRQQPAATLASKLHVLVADDSLTTRAMERSILEVAGYEVTAAADGAEAWALLQDRGADLVVSDVEMPRMDGFSLVETIRASSRFKDLPVILVTSRERPEDKARGLKVGANAYLVKNAFEQEMLLEAVARFV